LIKLQETIRRCGCCHPTPHFPAVRRAFTLLELLAVIAIVGLLFALIFPAIEKAKVRAKQASCASNLRQLHLATTMYLAENDWQMFPFNQKVEDGMLWYFGLEEGYVVGTPEGTRPLDKTRARLYPYISSVGGIELCPALDYRSSHFKMKFGAASYGYGVNYYLLNKLFPKEKDSQTALFADAAQVNAFQPPASPTNPLLEEFYYVNAYEKTAHFRHAKKANVVFCDGHVKSVDPSPGSLDSRCDGLTGTLPRSVFAFP
jgi:prepilin-type processing-associated H-X9-DG protein/prepilin-type N-terminal cleavage/methylation domain-containing protein